MNVLLAIVLAASAWTSDIRLEAEDADLVGVFVDTTRTGFSGTGYVTGFDEAGDSLRFHFELEAGVYDVRMAIAQSGRLKPYTIWIDGQAFSSALVGGGSGFIERSLREHRFSEGAHTLVVQGDFDVDYLRLVSVEYEPPVTPPARLSDPDATPSAQALLGFLKAQYGRQILSGQQTLSDIDYIEQVTGKEPAIGAFDLIEYSPSRIAHGANPNNASERWIDWADRDGIVSLMWHWNAPTDLIDSQSQPWWRGFYTEATTFNFAETLNDPSSERYRLMLRDIDAIAAQLQKFQDADVPVLWRPLHEAAGGWFWWGARGPEPFKALWRLLYDQLVNVHGLHNLIWVYTHEPNAAEWYPGDDYVDITSRDVYAGDPSATMQSDWEQLQTLYGDRMLVALSESGTLPDPEVITDFGIWWSWFSIWTGRFIRDIDRDYLRRVYLSAYVMTRDELPDWRGYTVAVEAEAPVPDGGVALYPNPSTGRVALRVALLAPSDVAVEVYDLLGRRVQALTLGARPAGTFETSIDMRDAAAGVYVVRVIAGSRLSHHTLVLTR